MFDSRRMESYGQDWKTIGFLSSVPTVLYLSGLWEEIRGPFRGQRNHLSLLTGTKTPEMARPVHNSG